MKRQITLTFTIVLVSVVFLLSSGMILCKGKKLIVTSVKANIYFEPDTDSKIIDVLNKGTIVTLGNARKFRIIFNYVYFSSGKTGNTKSGYILDTSVKYLSQIPKVITLKGEQENFKKPIQKMFWSGKVFWGMSRENLLEVEGKPLYKGQSQELIILGYQRKIMDWDCLVGFYFGGNSLLAIKYDFFNQQADKNQCIVDYEKLKNRLIQEYGKPVIDKVNWFNESGRNDIHRWGKEVSLGHLQYISQWKNLDAEVTLQLFGSENGISLEIEFRQIM